MFLLRASILLRSLTHSKFHVKSRSISQISVRDTPACAGTRSPPVSPPQLTDARRIRQCVDECTARIELGLHYRIPYPRPVSAPRASAAGPGRAPTGVRGRGPPPPPSGTPAGADIAFRCFMQTSVFSRLRPTRLLLIKEQRSDVRGTHPDSAQTSRPAEGRRSRPAPSRRKCQGPTPDRRDQQSGAALAQPSRGGLPAAASRSRTRSLCVRRPGPGALSAACSSCLLGIAAPASSRGRTVSPRGRATARPPSPAHRASPRPRGPLRACRAFSHHREPWPLSPPRRRRGAGRRGVGPRPRHLT